MQACARARFIADLLPNRSQRLQLSLVFFLMVFFLMVFFLADAFFLAHLLSQGSRFCGGSFLFRARDPMPLARERIRRNRDARRYSRRVEQSPVNACA